MALSTDAVLELMQSVAAEVITPRFRTLSDSQIDEKKPGDLIFAEDTKGKGHITRSLRDTRGFVHVAMPDDFDVTGWKLTS